MSEIAGIDTFSHTVYLELSNGHKLFGKVDDETFNCLTTPSTTSALAKFNLYYPVEIYVSQLPNPRWAAVISSLNEDQTVSLEPYFIISYVYWPACQYVKPQSALVNVRYDSVAVAFNYDESADAKLKQVYDNEVRNA